jgi:uncharacterized protein
VLGASSIGPAGPASAGDSWPLTANAEPDALLAAWARIVAWAAYGIPTALFGLIIPASILLGILAARHRILEEPGRHLRTLRRTAAVGLAIGGGTGLVVALQNLDALSIDRGLDYAFVGVHSFGGLFGGIGYVALFGLVAARLESSDARDAGPAWAIQAVGKRSLSCYLFQSVIFAPLLCAWGLGVGAYLSSWSVALLAVVVWVASVALAVALEREGRRGPAEWLLRRLAYPRPAP